MYTTGPAEKVTENILFVLLDSVDYCKKILSYSEWNIGEMITCQFLKHFYTFDFRNISDLKPRSVNILDFVEDVFY